MDCIIKKLNHAYFAKKGNFENIYRGAGRNYGGKEKNMEVEKEIPKFCHLYLQIYHGYLIMGYVRIFLQLLPGHPLFSSCTPTLLCKDKIYP